MIKKKTTDTMPLSVRQSTAHSICILKQLQVFFGFSAVCALYRPAPVRDKQVHSASNAADWI